MGSVMNTRQCLMHLSVICLSVYVRWVVRQQGTCMAAIKRLLCAKSAALKSRQLTREVSRVRFYVKRLAPGAKGGTASA